MKPESANSAIQPPTYEDVCAAAKRIKHVTHVTPLLSNPALDERAGAKILLKVEALQRTGSFKIRGAYNRLSQLSEQERKAGVVAWSSGNHAQGVASAAAILGISATIVMPADAPKIKTDNTRAFGAKIVPYDRETEDREKIAYRIADETGAIIVPSYDDPHIIAGQGTVGLELMSQAESLGTQVDEILAPVSGGGLIAGIGLAARAVNPNVKLYGVEPEGFDDHRRSLVSKQREHAPPHGDTLCDALLAPSPGKITWAINSEGLAGCYAVSDDDVRTAVNFAFKTLKLVVEPSGTAGLAAILSGQHQCAGQTIAVVLSGGNVDTATFTRCLSSAS